MKFMLDLNISKTARTTLRSWGHEVMGGRFTDTDAELLQDTIREKAILLTWDTDFLPMNSPYGIFVMQCMSEDRGKCLDLYLAAIVKLVSTQGAAGRTYTVKAKRDFIRFSFNEEEN